MKESAEELILRVRRFIPFFAYPLLPSDRRTDMEPVEYLICFEEIPDYYNGEANRRYYAISVGSDITDALEALIEEMCRYPGDRGIIYKWVGWCECDALYDLGVSLRDFPPGVPGWTLLPAETGERS